MSLVERAAARWQEMSGGNGRALKRPVIVPPTGVGERVATAPVSPARRERVAPPVQNPNPPIQFDYQQLKACGIADWSARSRLTEELRIIKRQLLRDAFGEGQDRKNRSNVIMVTSARPQEGKTFTSLNLAFSIVQDRHHHVLLIDADGTRQGIRRFVSNNSESGLLDVVGDPSLDTSHAIFPTGLERLSFVPAGAERQHGPELLASRGMRALIEEIATRYDDRLILIDAPPCLVSSDAATLAAIVGQVAFVIEADRTQRAEVEASLNLLQACPRISLILNKTQLETSDSFGAHRYPYYQ